MKKNIISLELLKEIIKYRYATIKSCDLSGKFIITTSHETNTKGKHNIYELANLCKEWAWNDTTLCGYNIELKSYKSSENGKYVCILMNDDITFIEDTEPEAIFKSCQWILENKGKKND